jgi:SAM-dependent methyltransferase
MPLPDATADVIISVFGVIFAPDAEAAAREMARVAAPAGRIVLSAWHPGGALGDLARVRREAVVNAAGEQLPAGPAPFAWDEDAALRDLFEPFGFTVSVAEASLPFTASSAEAFAQHEFRSHPAWDEAERVLDARALARLHQEATQLLVAANEDPDAFQVTSDYAVAILQRG